MSKCGSEPAREWVQHSALALNERPRSRAGSLPQVQRRSEVLKSIDDCLILLRRTNRNPDQLCDALRL